MEAATATAEYLNRNTTRYLFIFYHTTTLRRHVHTYLIHTVLLRCGEDHLQPVLHPLVG